VARSRIVITLLDVLLIRQSVLTLYVQPYSVFLKNKDRLSGGSRYQAFGYIF